MGHRLAFSLSLPGELAELKTAAYAAAGRWSRTRSGTASSPKIEGGRIDISCEVQNQVASDKNRGYRPRPGPTARRTAAASGLHMSASGSPAIYGDAAF